MLRTLMRAKIHRPRVTQCDLHYVGSITIDADLLVAVDLRPNELVQVYDIDNGARFETYVIRGEPGSGVIGLNGAAARLVEIDHRLIIVAFGQFEPHEIDSHIAKVVVCDDENRILERLDYTSVIEQAPEAASPR
jgi:aspartate 1-decarboxylase